MAVLLFLGEMLTATAMGFFQEELARALVLTLFIPLIISSGGNWGSQAATLVIRAWRWVRWPRRMVASGAPGTLLGPRPGLDPRRHRLLPHRRWSRFSPIYGPHALLVASTVALALVGVVPWGTLSGSTPPLVLKRLGFDPAVLLALFLPPGSMSPG